MVYHSKLAPRQATARRAREQKRSEPLRRLGLGLAFLTLAALTLAAAGSASHAGPVYLGDENVSNSITSIRATTNGPAFYATNEWGNGVSAIAYPPYGIGVYGIHEASSGSAPGVRGDTNSLHADAVGVLGQVTTSAPGAESAAVRGVNNSTTGAGRGVWGSHASGGYGVYGSAGAAGFGVVGTAGSGGTGGWFSGSGVGSGVYGQTTDGAGVFGRHLSTTGTQAGVVGETASGEAGASAVHGNGANAVGILGTSQAAAGVRGLTGTSINPGYPSLFGPDDAGVEGAGRHGVIGESVESTTATGVGVIGIEGPAGGQGDYAGYFLGSVHVNETLSKGGGAFKIDHPLDPANSYLQHSFVESPDMKNVYDGVVTTDGRGFATVRLPRYFQALNRDFRYQLTIVGRRGWRARVVREIVSNRFTIESDEPRVKVSWQVTGIRKDAFANANRIQVEQAKPARERGRYLHPEAYGKPKTAAVWYGSLK